MIKDQTLEKPLPDTREDDVLKMTSDIVSSFVSNNPIPSETLPDVIKSIHKTISDLSAPALAEAVQNHKPAVAVSRSVQDDYIICLEDGKKLKMLKRYLRSQYNLSPEEYRARWGLPGDYPMVAPSYARRRSEFAKQIGLGKDRKK